jgi:excisionase family DNA binding protein
MKKSSKRRSRPQPAHVEGETGEYTAEQVAKLFKVKVQTIYRWVHEGVLTALPSFPATSQRPRRRFDRAKVDELVKGLRPGEGD